MAEMKTGNRNTRTSLSNIFAIFVCLGCRGSNENEKTIVEYLRGLHQTVFYARSNNGF